MAVGATTQEMPQDKAAASGPHPGLNRVVISDLAAEVLVRWLKTEEKMAE